ncbi:MAG: hypothetical protein M0Z55_05725 [Peptococcaceae bacterium]|nr:hypothetical protein [Peptococcaceae bacterium]
MNQFTSRSEDAKFQLAERIQFGTNIVFGPSCKNITIGYGCFLGNDLYIDVPELVIGDYTTIHKGTTIHGYRTCTIGHNCWIGQQSIIDSIAGTSIGNNVGIGASSQLWSHAKFGDSLEGCQWNKSKPLMIEDDVWFAGHCIVSPIVAKKKAMLLVGGVITKDMEENHVYAGVPAKDITELVGPQFIEVPLESKINTFLKLYNEFLNLNNLCTKDFSIMITDNDNFDQLKSAKEQTVFSIKDRTYIPTRSDYEYRFMKFLLYDRAKFIPKVSQLL